MLRVRLPRSHGCEVTITRPLLKGGLPGRGMTTVEVAAGRGITTVEVAAGSGSGLLLGTTTAAGMMAGGMIGIGGTIETGGMTGTGGTIGASGTIGTGGMIERTAVIGIIGASSFAATIFFIDWRDI